MNTVRHFSKYIKAWKAAAVMLLVLCFAPEISATHIVGGDITFKKVGTNRFQVTLELRRDCFLGSPEAEFDDPAAIGIFSANGALQFGLGTNGLLLIPYNDSDTLNNIVESDCGFEGTQVCVHETKYVSEITLPYRPGGYILAYQRCCRNASLNNIEDPLETGGTYWIAISEEALLQDNDSPAFKQWPPVYICANKPINFDHSAFDSDGDSLVYRLCVPREGATRDRPKPQPPSSPPYDQVQWKPPYSLNNLMGGVPFRINSETGELTGTPNTVGQFLIGVCVEEYRNGVLISTVRRDFQYNVRVCSPPPTAIIDAPEIQCDGLEVAFENASISANKFQWYFNYPDTSAAFSSTETNPTFTYPASGTYQVFLKAVRGTDQCNDSTIHTITVFDADFVVDFNAELDACQPDGSVSYVFTDMSTIDVPGVGSQTWDWTIIQNGDTTTYTGNPLVADLMPGDFSVGLEVMATNGCVKDTLKSFLYEDFELQADFDVEAGGCNSEEDIMIILDDFSAEDNPDFTISMRDWKVIYQNNGQTDTIFASGDAAVVTIPRTDFSVMLTVTAANGCTDVVMKDFFIEDFIPTVDFTFELTGCNDDNNPLITLYELSNDSVLYSEVVAYIWNLNGNTLMGDTVTYESINEDTIRATLSVEFADGCFASATHVIVLDEIRPQVNFQWKPELCPDDETVNIGFFIDKVKFYGYGYDSIVWLIGTPGAVSTYVGDTVYADIPKDSLVSVFLSTNFDNGCSDIYEEVFYPGDFAQIELVLDTLILCPDEPANIVVNPNPNFTYTWSPEAGLDLTDPSNPVVKIVSDQTYYVTVSDGVCSVTDSIFIDVLEQINLFINGDDYTCIGDIELSVDGAVGPGTYQWSKTSDFSMIFSTDTTITDVFTGKQQTYYVRFVGEVCTATPASITVINQTPELELTDPFELCANDTITYLVENLIPEHDLTITWAEDPHILSGGNTLSPVITLFESDTNPVDLYITVVNQYGCTFSDTLTLIPGTNPVVDFTYEVNDCENYEVCFSLVGTYNGFPIWDLGDTTTMNDQFLIPEVCYTYPGPGTYTVSLTNAASICPFAAVEKTITLTGEVPIFGQNDRVDVCLGAEVAIPLPDLAPGLTYAWCDINGNEISTADTLKATVNENVQYILKVVDQNGCPFSDTIGVFPFDFTYDLSVPTVFCLGDTIYPLIDIAGGDVFSYVWTPEDCLVAGQGTAEPIILVKSAKTINVTVTHDVLGCVLNESFFIEPTQLEVSVAAEPDAEIYEGDSVEIYIVDPIQGDGYKWSNGSTLVSQFVSPTETTTYTVTVTDEDGCTGEASLTITVINPRCEEDVYLPNAFSPNGDDVNSTLLVRSNFVIDMELIIYNRWNEEVFRSRDQNIGWDGTFKGADLAPDVYAYWLTATCVDGVTITRRGNVSLLR